MPLGVGSLNFVSFSFDQVPGVPGWPTTGQFDPSQSRAVLGSGPVLLREDSSLSLLPPVHCCRDERDEK